MPIKRSWCALRHPRSRGARRAPDAPAAALRLLEASRWPLDECLVWEGAPGFACVWIRRHPELPRYAVAMVSGTEAVGLAHAAARVGAGRAEAWSWIEEARRAGPLVRVDPRVAEGLLRRGLARSRDAGALPQAAGLCELLASSPGSGARWTARTAEA